MDSGILAEWNDERGFGFIEKVGCRTFVHVSAFDPRNGRPQVGDLIQYQVGIASDGRGRALRAIRVDARSAERQASGRGRIDNLAFVPVVLFLAGLAVAVAIFGTSPLVAGAYLAMSLVTYLLYVGDKRAAVAGTWRTSEQTLQLAALCCGWPGAVAAQQFLRHKNRKPGFQLTFWLVVCVNVAGCTVLIAWPEMFGIGGHRPNR